MRFARILGEGEMPAHAAPLGVGHVELTGIVVGRRVSLDIPSNPARFPARRRPSRRSIVCRPGSAVPTALAGMELVAAVAAAVEASELLELALALPPTLNVVLTIGHAPLLVHDLKWMVWVPALMPTFVASMSYLVTPRTSVPLLSIEYPNAVGVRPSQPTL